MTSKEIFESEQDNTEQIRLYAEGLFWKAYERSAYACCTQLRAFKATKRYIKAMDGEIVSIGFPKTSLSTLAGEEQLISCDDKNVVLRCKEAIDEKMFVAWKKLLPLATSARKAKEASCTVPQPSADPLIPSEVSTSATVDTSTPPTPQCDYAHKRTEMVVEKLRTYNLAEHTPMEAMMFIAELKRLLNEH